MQQRTYEVMFIVRPDVEDADLDKLIAGYLHNNTATTGGAATMTIVITAMNAVR